jgi:ribose 1,5-bisphosphokinase
MSEAQDHVKSNSGTLFLLVGPSGSGKGPLLHRLREKYQNDSRFHFPKRVITRAVHMPEETHIHATEEAFSNAQEGDAFMLHWHTHGHKYGIPGHALIELLNGKHVLINVSRTVVDQARSFYSPIKVIHVETGLDTSFKRLKERGRESEEEIAQRLKRHDLSYPLGSDVVHIKDDGETEEAFQETCAIIEDLLKEP